LIHWFAVDDDVLDYHESLLNQVLTNLSGRSPVVTLLFSHTSLATIRSGGIDATLDSWARRLGSKAPATIYFRMFHEFNQLITSTNPGYPWGICGATSNQPFDLVAAWRHIHDRFMQAGATNVKFIWSPDGTFSATSMYDGSTCAPLSAAYPGD